jgi:hypothetical protein
MIKNLLINESDKYVIITAPLLVSYSKIELFEFIENIIPYLKNGYKCFYCERGEPINNNYIKNLKTLSNILLDNNIDRKKFTIIYENNSESFISYLEKNGFDYVFAIRWLLFATPTQFVKNNYIEEKLDKKFLFLNRVEKYHRIKLFNFFEKENILDNCYYSARWKNLNNFNEDYESEAVKLRVEIHNHLLKIYQQSYLHIVTETTIKDKVEDIDRMFFSEKTFRHLAFDRPFILVAQKNSLKKLHEYGFKTFSPFIDEGYDSLDMDDRIEYIKQVVKNLNEKSDSELHEICENCKDIFLHNRNRLFELAGEIKNNIKSKYPIEYKDIQSLFLHYYTI